MTHAALSPLIGPEFDEFLGASIGEDRNGTGLSVLSALARLDVDPWKEATSLARMPREAAAVRLTELIEALPLAPASAIPSRMSAADLVALLPKGKALDVRSSDSAFAATGLRQTQVLMALSAFAIMMLIVFAISALFSPGPRKRRKSVGASRRRRHDSVAAQAWPLKFEGSCRRACLAANAKAQRIADGAGSNVLIAAGGRPRPACAR